MSSQNNSNIKSYSDCIREAFIFLLKKNKNVYVFGQGLWSPWYVGNSMKDLDKIFGKDRIIESPVSENATTGLAIGASLFNIKPIVVHPRMDFMLLATDTIVNQAAKWSSMLGGASIPGVTIRSIINRGGEQGAQHSQLLHSWFAHTPGLRVLVPYSPQDAQDFLISATLSKDPVIYIDDRWLYDEEDKIKKPKIYKLSDIKPQIIKKGDKLTIVSSGYSTLLAKKVSLKFKKNEIEIIDLRSLNPIQYKKIYGSVSKTNKLVVIDGGWPSCGIASEIISTCSEKFSSQKNKYFYKKISIANAPAPSSLKNELNYYPDINKIYNLVKKILKY